jgi:hypothetical protein
LAYCPEMGLIARFKGPSIWGLKLGIGSSPDCEGIGEGEAQWDYQHGTLHRNVLALLAQIGLCANTLPPVYSPFSLFLDHCARVDDRIRYQGLLTSESLDLCIDLERVLGTHSFRVQDILRIALKSFGF